MFAILKGEKEKKGESPSLIGVLYYFYGGFDAYL
jgi:hypothetical protein